MTPRETLLAAADLLEQKGWTQGFHALDSQGGPIRPEHKDAACFCAIGSIYRISPSHKVPILFKKFIRDKHKVSIVRWNDSPDQTAENVIKTMRDCAEGLG